MENATQPKRRPIEGGLGESVESGDLGELRELGEWICSEPIEEKINKRLSKCNFNPKTILCNIGRSRRRCRLRHHHHDG